MAISRVGVVGANDNAPLVLPTHGRGDVVVLFTMGDGASVVPALTPGFTQGNSASSGSSTLPGRIQEEYMFLEGTEFTIPPNSVSDVSRIAAVYRGLVPVQPALESPYYGGNINVNTLQPRVVFNDAGIPSAGMWYLALASVVMNGVTTDQTTAPAGIVRHMMLQDQQQYALYDSDGGAYPTLPLNGPAFSTPRNFRLLGTTLVPLADSYVIQTLEPIFLVSTADVNDVTNASLSKTIEITLDAEAFIPEVQQAELEKTIFITASSTANIVQPEPVYCTPDPAPVINNCVSVVNHAVYTSLRLFDVLQNALFPAIRESNPATAYDTMDDWLDRLNWQDCMGACRMPGINGVLPTEIVGECGSYVAELTYPGCLVDTVKHGIILALTRMQLGRTKNLCAVNEIIAPLGAVVYPTPGQESECPHKMTIAPTTDIFTSWAREECNGLLPGTCTAYYVPTPLDPAGLPSRIYPGLMAAECLVRSMFTQHRFIEFTRLIAVPPSIPNCSSFEM